MICKSAELDWEEVWLARSWDLFQRGLMLGDGFLALGFVPAMRIGVVERVIRRGDKFSLLGWKVGKFGTIEIFVMTRRIDERNFYK